MDPISIGSAIAALIGLFKGGGQQVPQSGLSPEMQAQLMKMLQLQTQRASESAPIHQAAMAMATRLAPTYARGAMSGAAGGPSGSSTAVPTNSGGAPGSSPAMDAVMNWIASNGGNSLTLGPNGGPGSPDPFLNGSPSLGPQGPGIAPQNYRPLSNGWRGWFSPNPGNAFVGGGTSGGGEQNPSGNGGGGRAY